MSYETASGLSLAKYNWDISMFQIKKYSFKLKKDKDHFHTYTLWGSEFGTFPPIE